MSAALRREQAEMQERLARKKAKELEQQQQQALQQQQRKQRFGAAVTPGFVAMLQENNDDFLSRLGHAEARDADQGKHRSQVVKTAGKLQQMAQGFAA